MRWLTILPEIQRSKKSFLVQEASSKGILDTVVPRKTRERRTLALRQSEVLDVGWQQGGICCIDTCRHIGTRGITVCTAITIYDNANRIGCLLHLTPITNTEASIGEAVRQLIDKGAVGNTINACLFNFSHQFVLSTLKTGEYDVYVARKCLEDHGTGIIEEDVLEQMVVNLVLDLETSEVCDWVVARANQ